jgi:dTDP-4-amino-4,6-dideoxygalactose transaminase
MAQIPDTHRAEPIPEAALAEVMRLLGDGDLFRYHSDASPVAALEAEFAEMMGVRYALAVSSCSAALFLALEALDLSPGARILIPAFTFAAVPSAVVHAGLVPLLCECGPDYRLDMEDVAAKLPQADAVLVSHMRGHTSDMNALLALAQAAGVPLIEDAAHSLGTTWHGRRIGTLGRLGCFSFQSYKMLNAGEGGMLIGDDADLMARAVIMSGAYEHNWRKHPEIGEACAQWQNRLPLYNMRLGNLSAAILRPQLAALPRRVRDGRRNHDAAAAILDASPWIEVPAPLPGELRAPDSIQFNLPTLTEGQIDAFVRQAGADGVSVQVFGRSPDNARAFWNWAFLGPAPDLPRTRAMVMRACDVRLPARLTEAESAEIAHRLASAADMVTRLPAAS